MTATGQPELMTTGLGWPVAAVPRLAPRVRLPWYPPSCAQYAWLGHHPRLLAAWGALAGPAEFLQWAFASLHHRDIELVNLRASWNAGGFYHWAYHLIWSRVRGKGADYRAALKTGPDAPFWSERDAVLLRSVDELHDDLAISPPTLARLRAHFDQRQLIEICFITGHYELLAMTYESISLPYDGWRPEPPVAMAPQPRRPRQARVSGDAPQSSATHLPSRSWFPLSTEAGDILAAHPMLHRLLRNFARNSSRFPTLDAHDQQAAVRRVLWRAGVHEELSHHPMVDARHPIVLTAVDDLDAECFVRDETWAHLAAALDARQLIELCFLVGHYRTFAMMLNTFGGQR